VRSLGPRCPPRHGRRRSGREVPATRPKPGSRYTAPAVLGGELAVPCTCNPLQQG